MAERYAARTLVNPCGSEADRVIVVEDGRVADVVAAGAGGGRYAATGHYAVPGFVDIHTNGGGGADVSQASPEALSRVARYHLSGGTTAFVGTVITTSLQRVRRMLARGRELLALNQQAAREGVEASLLGFHLEGPWISTRNAGAHDRRHIRAPDAEAHDLIRQYSDMIPMVTLSYHYESAPSFLEALVSCGVVPALGHDETDDRDALEAFARGARVVTHLYSSCSSFHRREGLKHLGTLEMALMTPGISVEVIADGYHITDLFWRFIRHNKQVDDIIVVSDSISAAGLPEDPTRVHRVGDVDVVVDGGVAWLPDRSLFAGSVGSLHSMFVRLVADWGERIEDAVAMTSSNPAVLLGQGTRWGRIAPGCSADFLLLDENLSILEVVKSGMPAATRRE